MNKSKFSFLTLLFALLTQASTLSSQSLQTIQKMGIGINGLELAVEIPVAENITIEPTVGLGLSYDFWPGSLVFKLIFIHIFFFN